MSTLNTIAVTKVALLGLFFISALSLAAPLKPDDLKPRELISEPTWPDSRPHPCPGISSPSRKVHPEFCALAERSATTTSTDSDSDSGSNLVKRFKEIFIPITNTISKRTSHLLNPTKRDAPSDADFSNDFRANEAAGEGKTLPTLSQAPGSSPIYANGKPITWYNMAWESQDDWGLPESKTKTKLKSRSKRGVEKQKQKREAYDNVIPGKGGGKAPLSENISFGWAHEDEWGPPKAKAKGKRGVEKEKEKREPFVVIPGREGDKGPLSENISFGWAHEDEWRTRR